jgi:hypothetical protein
MAADAAKIVEVISTVAEEETAEHEYSEKEKSAYENNVRTVSTLPMSLVSLISLIRAKATISEEAERILSYCITALSFCVAVGMFIAARKKPYRSVGPHAHASNGSPSPWHGHSTHAHTCARTG